MKKIIKALKNCIKFAVMISPVSMTGVAVVLGILALAPLIFLLLKFSFFSAKEEVQVAPVITEIKKINELYVSKIYLGFFQIVDGGEEYGIRDLRVRGEAFISVNLNTLNIVEKNDVEKTITLELDNPCVKEPTVLNGEDGTTTFIEDLPKGLENHARAYLDSMDKKIAQKEIERRAGRPLYIKNSKEQAVKMLRSLFEPIGWKVTVKWKSDMTGDVHK